MVTKLDPFAIEEIKTLIGVLEMEYILGVIVMELVDTCKSEKVHVLENVLEDANRAYRKSAEAWVNAGNVVEKVDELKIVGNCEEGAG